MRWLGVWLPVTGVAFLIVLMEGFILYLHLSWQFTLATHLLMMGLVTVGAYFFSGYIFGVIHRKEEEILQKHRELGALERRFRALIENSSDGILLLTPEGTFLYASPSTTRLVGYAVEELVGRSGFELIHPEDREYATARFSESLVYSERVVRAQFRVRHQDGSWRWIEAVIRNLLADPSVQAIIGNYRDITESKRGEEALRRARDELEVRVRERTEELVRANESLQATLVDRQRAAEALGESQAQLASIIASAMEAIISIDEDQRIIVFNAAAERTFRVSAVEVVGQPVRRFIPERFLPTHLAGVRDFGRMNLEKWWIGVLGAATALRADGTEFPIEAAISQVEVAGRKLYTIILRDITERKQVEEELRDSREQLRSLASRVVSVREEERSRVAREVHDKLGQTLAGLKIDLAWVLSKLPADQPLLVEKMRAMVSLTDSTIQAVRRIVTELRPGVLDDLGLVSAIEWQAAEFQGRTGIRCEFSSDRNDFPLVPQAGTAVFRICQETLTNVARHAQATRVTISLREEAGNLVLTVSDNGRGITEQEIADRASLGLLGMRERAIRVSGEVSIGGRPGEGTTVRVWIPLGESVPESASGARS